jgi:endonuclease/exonuclease/phosphatase family metal-dependent hydrolase
MRVLTLNLWGRRGDWDARRLVLVEALRELRPDLVAFQEAVVTEEYDQAADLLGAEFHLAHQRERLLPGRVAERPRQRAVGDVHAAQSARARLGLALPAARLRPRALRGARRTTLEVTACARVLDEPVDGVWATDHFGVVAELELPRAS